jgi:hypothetical protein
MYETEKKARDAIGKLKDEGFPADTIFLVKPVSEGQAGTAGDLSVAVMAGFVPRQHADVYAAALPKGRSIVSIRAPFGQGKLATAILDGCGPVDVGVGLPQERPIGWEEGAPLSSALLLPTLLRNKPAPFSSLMSFPILSDRLTFGASRYKLLADSEYTFFAPKQLSDNPAPLSSMFKLSLLSGRTGPAWRSSFGLPMLSRNPVPLSSLLGLNLLKAPARRTDPAPFSATIGLPTLSHGRTFLSRLFGELASPHFALFGRNPLTRNAAPLSSMFGFRILSHKGGSSWTSSFGLPLLGGPGPSLSGLPLLSRNPAPLSSLLGLPTLSRFQ